MPRAAATSLTTVFVLPCLAHLTFTGSHVSGLYFERGILRDLFPSTRGWLTWELQGVDSP